VPGVTAEEESDVNQTETRLEVVVDWDLCQSHGQCEFAAPDVFTINDEGDLEADERPPAEQRAAVEEAVRRCPTQALRLVVAD
jgi:ferredoxin